MLCVTARRSSHPDLSALRTFVAVAATGSMTAAARSLGLTQSAVSQTIRHLEESFGVVLIERAQRPLRVTPAGRTLHREAGMLIDEADGLLARVRQSASDRLVELRVGIIDSFAATVGPRLLRTLLASAGSVSFRSGLARDQAEGLLSRQLDLIITSENLDDFDGLERHPIASEPFLLLLPPTQRAASRASGTPPLVFEPANDLRALAARAPLVRFSSRSQIGAQIERHLRRRGVRAARFLEVDATDAMLAMVAGGQGWAIATPLCLLQGGSQVDRVRAEPLPGPRFSRELYLITRAGEYAKLSSRIAAQSRDILRRECVPVLRRLLPWLAEPIILAGEPADEHVPDAGAKVITPRSDC